MQAVLSFIATWALAVLGFMLLAISQKQHQRLLPSAPSGLPTFWLRPVGWALLAFSPLPVIWRDGVAFGLLAWSMILTLSTFATVGVIAGIKRKIER